MEIHRINLDKHYLEENSVLHKIDPRVKTISTISLIFSIVSMQNLQIPTAITIIALTVLKKLKINIKSLIFPSTVVATVFIIVLFTYGGKDIIWSYRFLSITQESLNFALLILVRVLASLTVLYVYLSTTRVNEIVMALSWLRMPKEIVELMFLMLRYVGTISKEAERMYFSAKSKHAFSKSLPYFKKLRNFGMLAGALFLRSLDRADRVYLGMLSKGFSFKVPSDKLKVKDIFQIITLFLIIFLIVYIDRVIL